MMRKPARLTAKALLMTTAMKHTAVLQTTQPDGAKQDKTVRVDTDVKRRQMQPQLRMRVPEQKPAQQYVACYVQAQGQATTAGSPSTWVTREECQHGLYQAGNSHAGGHKGVHQKLQEKLVIHQTNTIHNLQPKKHTSCCQQKRPAAAYDKCPTAVAEVHHKMTLSLTVLAGCFPGAQSCRQAAAALVKNLCCACSPIYSSGPESTAQKQQDTAQGSGHWPSHKDCKQAGKSLPASTARASAAHASFTGAAFTQTTFVQPLHGGKHARACCALGPSPFSGRIGP
jgi:hypothetical protein